MYQQLSASLKILLGTLFAFFFLNAKATHIVGGEINYKYISKNTYEINLTVYRDCGKSTNAPYDQEAWIGFFDHNNDSVTVLRIPFTGSDTLPLSINSKCAKEPSGICYEVTHYIDTIELPPIPGGYQVVYQRCCWNLSVTNIKNPHPPSTPQGSAGLTIHTWIPDANMVEVNSNPVFQELTPPFICHGTEFRFNHAAIDPDGDSLTYRIVTPYDAPLANAYEFPPAPPYALAQYRNGFSLSNVMGGEPLRIDAHTGFVQAKPDQIGQFVFAVQVLEYRDGIQIGETTRSYQLNTDFCPDLTYAFIDVPDAVCGSNTIDFKNASQGASKYKWSFGDPSNPGAGSLDPEPTYQYPGDGQYIVSLIAISDIDTLVCNDTTSKTLTISDEYKAEAELEHDPCLNVGKFTGNATSVGNKGNTWHWKFGDGDEAFIQNPTHQFPKSQKYIVTLITELEPIHEGCVDSVKMEYMGFDRRPYIEASANKYIVYERADSAFLSTSIRQNIKEYRWKPTESLNNSRIPNPIAKPKETTSYVVTIIDENGCKNRDTVTIYINPYRCGEDEIFIPNAFTPNNDGENDYFRIRGEDIEELYLAVYNRWGQRIYESSELYMINDEKFGWDGTFRGEELATGVFVYYLRAVCPGGNEFTKKGNITLIR